MPRKSKNIPANESPEARFIRVATDRVNRMLTAFKQLGSLGNTSQYGSKVEQRNQIKEALQTALNRSMEALNKGGETAPEFKLK